MIEGQGRTCKGRRRTHERFHRRCTWRRRYWVLYVGVKGANRSKPEHIYGCALAEVGTTCKAVDLCLHTVDASPKEEGRGALGTAG